MANIMSLKNLRNKPSRNGFDLSCKRNFTGKPGELLPTGSWEILPGDVAMIDLKSLTRTAPLNTAANARIREYYDFYFVPYQLLWNKANTVLTQMYDNPQHATSLDPTLPFTLKDEMPYITCEQIVTYLSTNAHNYKNYFGYDRGILSCKLLEYLGYGDFMTAADGGEDWDTTPMQANLNLNIFNLLAYQKIYADYYRDSQWERVSPSTFNVDYLGVNNSMNLDISDESFAENYNFFDLRYCNWQKDLFHGVLPRQQYGEASFVEVDSDYTGGFSILALRQAEFLQKWKEIAQSGNKDYKEQIEKHWNVSVGDAYSEMCEYIGGFDSTISINEVINNNITGDNNAKIAGKGIGVSNGQLRFESNGRYGVLMCIYHALPLLDYTTSFVLPMNTRIHATDYAIPEFDRVGMQNVPLVHLSNPANGSLPANTILGYAPRYIDYKTSCDFSVGEYRYSLSNWLMSYDDESVYSSLSVKEDNNVPPGSTDPANNRLTKYPFFKVNPNSVNPIFSVEADETTTTDNLWVSAFFDIKMVRNLDVDGLPY